MPRRFESPIEVPSKVLVGLEAVQGAGKTNMTDYRMVQAAASGMGYPEVMVWLNEHHPEYTEGIFRGFVAAK